MLLLRLVDRERKVERERGKGGVHGEREREREREEALLSFSLSLFSLPPPMMAFDAPRREGRQERRKHKSWRRRDRPLLPWACVGLSPPRSPVRDRVVVLGLAHTHTHTLSSLCGRTIAPRSPHGRRRAELSPRGWRWRRGEAIGAISRRPRRRRRRPIR